MNTTNSSLRICVSILLVVLCLTGAMTAAWAGQYSNSIAMVSGVSAVSHSENGVSAALLNRLGIEKGPTDPRHGLASYKLKSNGLSILLAERHAAPVVTVMMLYRVGSRNEAVGYTGSTHFLEHMMFKGSEKFDPTKNTGIDDVLKPIGGLNNATTWLDRTSYFEVVPANYLNLALSFEADRMRHLLLREKDRSSEMTVVRNELERNENDPHTLLETQTFATAFVEHPYHHPTIGWRTDVEGVPLARLKQFHEDFYWPNNSTVLIVGDIQPAPALEMVAKNFGLLPRSPKPIPTVYTVEPPQEGERRFVVQRGADLPRVNIAWHTVKAADKDIYALAMIESILGDSSRQSTRLYRALVDTGLASECYAYSYELRDPGLFVVSATATSGTKPPALEKAALAAVDKLKEQPVSQEELNRARLAVVKRLKLQTMDPLGLAEQIGEAVAVADWQFWSSYEDRLNAVTPADIARVARKYFQQNNRTVGYYLPKTGTPVAEQPEGAASDQPESSTIPAKAPEATQPPAVQHYRSSNEPAGRLISAASVAPSAVTQSSFAKRVRRKVLPNGLEVMILPIPHTDTMAISGKIRSGSYFAGKDKDLAPELLADMLTRGSSKFTKEQLAEQLDNMGSSLEFSCGNFWIEFSSRVVSADLQTYLPLLSDVLQHPALSETELKKGKKIVESDINQRMQDTRDVAKNALAQALYKPDNVYYEKPYKDQLAELPGITTQDLAALHNAQFTPENTVLAIVGDVDPDKAFAMLEQQFGTWKGTGKPSAITPPEQPAPAQSKKIAINLPDKENVDISIGRPVPVNFHSPDYFPSVLANAALGHGSFSTRLSPIREKYGLTYNIYSTFDDPAYGGAPWLIDCSVNPKNVDRALSLINGIVAEYVKQGIKKDELALEAKHVSGEFLVGLRRPDSIAKILTQYEMLGLSPERMDRFSEYLKAVTQEQANEAIRKYFPMQHTVTTMAGTLSR